MGLRLEVAEQIWDLLVLDPVCLTERIHALEWFIELVSPLPDEPCTLMTDRDAKALLHGRICELDPFKLDFTAFRCFRTFFAKVRYSAWCAQLRIVPIAFYSCGACVCVAAGS